MHEFYGDINVKRRGYFERRADQGLIEVADLAAARTLDINSHWWQRLETNDAGVQSVVLPDATTLEIGWQVVVQNYGTTDAIEIYKDDTTTLVQSVAISGYAYAITLMDKSTTNGIWHVNYLEDSQSVAAARYVKIFNATTDWGADLGTIYQQDIPQSTHQRGVHPVYQMWRVDGADYRHVFPNNSFVSAIGDVSWNVPSPQDLRFAGKIVLI